jgi:hypothetical protein
MGIEKKKRILFMLIVGTALLAVLLSACAGPPQTETNAPAVEMPGEIQRIALEDSKAAFENGEATFLDVRSASSYAASHIPGALSIPLADLQSRMDELDPDQWIITYCT